MAVSGEDLDFAGEGEGDWEPEVRAADGVEVRAGSAEAPGEGDVEEGEEDDGWTMPGP